MAIPTEIILDASCLDGAEWLPAPEGFRTLSDARAAAGLVPTAAPATPTEAPSSLDVAISEFFGLPDQAPVRDDVGRRHGRGR